MPQFQNEPLGDMVAVGAITPGSFRLWIRSEQPGAMRIRWRPESSDQMAETTVKIPADSPHDRAASAILPGPPETTTPLRPLTRYVFEVWHGGQGHCIGRGTFETAPAHQTAPPERYAIAFMSCNLPFDQEGRVRLDAQQMLRATRTCLERHNTKLVLMMGDQLYSDWPPALSLFNPDHFPSVAPPGRDSILDCTVEEIRHLFHQYYRHYWSIPELQSIHAEYPCYPILDDHDIVDNWGTDPAHNEPRWQRLARGARFAYLDYQASRVQPLENALPDSFHYVIEYADSAFFVMDLRSERTPETDGQLYSPSQEDALREFLRLHTETPFLFIVLSVPVVHLPRTLARVAARITRSGEDFSDRWSSGAHIRDRDRFLKIIHEHQRAHPDQKLTFLSGDIHIACVHRIQWAPDGPSLVQAIASGITNATGPAVHRGSEMLIRANREVATMDRKLKAAVHLLKGVNPKPHNPYGHLNLGIVELAHSEENHPASMRFLIYGHEENDPALVYESPWM